MTVSRVRLPTPFPGGLVKTQFKDSKVQAYFCGDGTPVNPLVQSQGVDFTALDVNFTYNLETVGPIARLSLWFDEVDRGDASFFGFVEQDNYVEPTVPPPEQPTVPPPEQPTVPPPEQPVEP